MTEERVLNMKISPNNFKKVAVAGISLIVIFGVIAGIYHLNGNSTDITATEVMQEIGATESESILSLQDIHESVALITEDSLRFKTEYEALNRESNEDGTYKYTHLSINEDNNAVYLEYTDLIDFVNYGTGLLYFGRPACPWCRLLVPPMLEFANENGVPVYYYDIEKDREENNAKYINILSIFQAYLPTDTVTQSEDEHDFDPKLKRVVLPQLFFMENGRVQADLLMFQHEYLRDNEPEKVKQLLGDMQNSTAVTSGNDIDDEDCGCE